MVWDQESVKLLGLPLIPKAGMSGAPGKRIEKHEQSITDAIAAYKATLAEYERLAQTECPSYSIIEIAKLKVADAFLDSRKIPTAPKQH